MEVGEMGLRRKRGGGIVGGFHVPVMCGSGDGEAEEIEKQLSREGSHFSLSSGMLPSLGARSDRRIKLRGLVISPFDKRYR